MEAAGILMLWIAGGLLCYLALGYLLHRVVFPEPAIELASYFKPGDVFASGMEKLQQTVITQEGGRVYTRVELEPEAPGPPLHIHETFDETFIVKGGTLSLIVAGQTKTLGPGEQLTVARKVAHKPFNPTPQAVVVEVGGTGLPEAFAVYLSQFYRFLDEDERNRRPPRILLQLALSIQHMDTWLAEGPPPAFQKALFFLLAPAARALGYRSFYEQYRI